MDKAELLNRAAEAVAANDTTYGPPAKGFELIAARWSLVLGCEVTAAQVALCLIDLKMARLTHHPTHLDSIVDVAGYAACAAELVEADENTGLPNGATVEEGPFGTGIRFDEVR